MVLEAPFEEEITGMAITTLVDTKEQITFTMKINSLETRQCLKSQMIHMKM